MRGIGVCRGAYAPALRAEWHAWDARVGSENDPVDNFPANQLYVVYAIANGGTDLEKFELRSFTEARSILLQVSHPRLLFLVYYKAFGSIMSLTDGKKLDLRIDILLTDTLDLWRTVCCESGSGGRGL